MAENDNAQTDNNNDFDEREMLEELLRVIKPRADIKLIADNLLEEFGSLKNVMQAPIPELKNIDGINDKFALQLGFVGAFMNYINDTKAPVKTRFDDVKIITEYCIRHFRDRTTEALTLIMLDDKSKLLDARDISSNMPNHVDVDFRQIIRQIMNVKTRKLIIAHNHPTVSTEPSNADLRFTRELGDFLKIIGIELVDHIIVSGSEALSMREAGYLKGIWGIKYRRPK